MKKQKNRPKCPGASPGVEADGNFTTGGAACWGKRNRKILEGSPNNQGTDLSVKKRKNDN